ncbi:MAG: response regulator transcription factor [Anaerolineae bacterium]|nr:response regulator transcription factor [Anaerolineae bacterium]
MIRILICDDQMIVCEGLRVIFESDPEIEVVGIANDGAQAIDLIPTAKPELVLLDLKMPIMNGVQAARLIREQFPMVHVLVLTTYDADEWVFDAIRSGAEGYLLKDTPREDLIKAVKDTVAGKHHIDPSIAGKLLNAVKDGAQPQQPDTMMADQLSDRERDVLRLLAKGLNNPEIAQQLFLSEGTVRNYISEILAKLNVSDRTQAALMAVRYRLVD